MPATCNSCGACCDPVSLPFTQSEMAQATDVPLDIKRWVLYDLTPMSGREAKAKEPWIFAHNIVAHRTDESIPFFYRCRHFDPEQRVCTAYEQRSSACRDYPWGDKAPNPNAALPPSCSFREDIGKPVEVRLVAKPAS